MGRQSDYKPEYEEEVEKLCKLGATDAEICDFFGCGSATLMRWKEANPSFVAAIKRGKMKADAEVASKLYTTAIGYKYKDVHVSNYQGQITVTEIEKYMHPNPVSCFFWLKNRRKEEWRDKHEYEVKGTQLTPDQVQDEELIRWMAFNYRKVEEMSVNKSEAQAAVKQMKKLHKEKPKTIQ